jgi:hypothetical protein
MWAIYCDGFAQSINLWNQKTPLLGNKHIPNAATNVTNSMNALPGDGFVNTVQHSTIDEAVFSM